MIFPMPKTKHSIIKTIYECEKIKISDIIKKVHSSQKSVYAYLDDLMKSGVIREERIGAKPLLRYFLPRYTDAGMLCFALLEEEKSLEFFKTHPSMKGPFDHFKKVTSSLIHTAIIFGSFARGTETKSSDIDIAIIAEKTNKKVIESAAENCFVTLTIRPSIRLFTAKEFTTNVKNHDPLCLQIKKDHIIITNSICWIRLTAEQNNH